METIFKRRSVRKYTETPVTDHTGRHGCSECKKQSGMGVYRFAGPGDL